MTTGVLVLLGISFVTRLFLPGLTGLSILLNPGGHWWGLLTYPLAEISPLALVLGGLWLYLAGGQLERWWGGRRYGLALAVSGPLSALTLALGSVLLGQPIALAGMALPLASLTVAWCINNRDGVIAYGFVLPIPVRIFLWLDLLLIYLYTAVSFGPLMGLFALGGPGIAYLYANRQGPERKWRAAVRRSRQKHDPPRRKGGLRRIK